MNPPVATPFFFYGLSLIMIIGGILVITRKNAVHSALALITTLLAQAALYLMLYAPFVVGVQDQLDRHQDDDDVPAGQNADHAQNEESGAEHQVMQGRDVEQSVH